MKKIVLTRLLYIGILFAGATALVFSCTNNDSLITSNQVDSMDTDISTSGFDDVLWRDQYQKFNHDNPRSGMISDLEQEVLRKGMSQETVREILGPPEQTEGNMDLYDLGASPVGVDYEQYVIEYDDDQKVVRFFIRRG